MVLFKNKNLTRVEISSADPSLILTKITAQGIKLYGITQVDDVTVRLLVAEKDTTLLKDEVNKQGSAYRTVEPSAVRIWLRRLPYRALLIVGIIFIALNAEKILEGYRDCP